MLPVSLLLLLLPLLLLLDRQAELLLPSLLSQLPPLLGAVILCFFLSF